MNISEQRIDPIAIGGMGGSGTRLVAEIVRELGVYMGGDLNAASDNLWFTLLFKRNEILTLPERDFSDLLNLFICRMHDRAFDTQEALSLLEPLVQEDRYLHTCDWLKERADSFMRPETISDSAHRWGWKEPNTHIVLDRLIQHMPNMKYIHVVRNGLDMAYSSNQNQLVNWGEFILGKPIEMTPSSSLQYWCAMHRRVLEIGTQMGDSQFMWLNYDALCSHPQQELPKLLQFLEVGDRSTNAVKLLLKHIKPPASQGRFKAQGIRHFSTDDIAFVKQLGFDIGP